MSFYNLDFPQACKSNDLRHLPTPRKPGKFEQEVTIGFVQFPHEFHACLWMFTTNFHDHLDLLISICMGGTRDDCVSFQPANAFQTCLELLRFQRPLKSKIKPTSHQTHRHDPRWCSAIPRQCNKSLQLALLSANAVRSWHVRPRRTRVCKAAQQQLPPDLPPAKLHLVLHSTTLLILL